VETYVLLRRDWTAANVLALASEGLQPILAGADLIVFGRVDAPIALKSSTHDALLEARMERDQAHERICDLERLLEAKR